ncbi:MAG: hypothetical protein ACRC33_10585 [Gemmataceae bacterium]
MTTTTFAGFRRTLLDLGFLDRTPPAGTVRLEHPETDTVVLLRPLRPEDPVEPVVVLGYRRVLDAKGVVAADDFDEMLRQHNAAG